MARGTIALATLATSLVVSGCASSTNQPAPAPTPSDVSPSDFILSAVPPDFSPFDTSSTVDVQIAEEAWSRLSVARREALCTRAHKASSTGDTLKILDEVETTLKREGWLPVKKVAGNANVPMDNTIVLAFAVALDEGDWC